MSVTYKTTGTKILEACVYGLACYLAGIFLFSFIVSAGEVKCVTNSYGNMTCAVTDNSNGIKSADTFTVKKPDFLRRQKVVNAENKTVAVCKENFYGNLKCRSK